MKSETLEQIPDDRRCPNKWICPNPYHKPECFSNYESCKMYKELNEKWKGLSYPVN